MVLVREYSDSSFSRLALSKGGAGAVVDSLTLVRVVVWATVVSLRTQHVPQRPLQDFDAGAEVLDFFIVNQSVVEQPFLLRAQGGSGFAG